MFRARTLRHTSALFYKRLKKIVPRALLSYVRQYRRLKQYRGLNEHSLYSRA